MQIERRDFLIGTAAAATAMAIDPARAAEWTPPDPARELHVPVRGGKIYVRVNGDLSATRAPAVFIHGGPGSGHASFLPTLQLCDQRAVILYDQLDSGLSDHPGDPANWTIERFVSEIDAIRAALDLKHLHVVGHSWGTTVGLEYAARRPGGLKSLTLSSPCVSAKSWEASTEAQLATLPTDVQDTINSHERAGTTDDPAYVKAMDIFYAHFLRRFPEPDYVIAYRKRTGIVFGKKLYETMWGPGEIRATGILKGFDCEPSLEKVDVPTLMLCGEYDEMSPAAAKPLAARMRNANFVTIPNSGHVSVTDQPAVFVRTVREHLNSHDGVLA